MIRVGAGNAIVSSRPKASHWLLFPGLQIRMNILSLPRCARGSIFNVLDAFTKFSSRAAP